MVKVDEDGPTVFGMDNLDEQQPITVVEVFFNWSG